MIDEPRNYYAQFRCDGGDASLYAELVSSAFLEPANALTSGQVEGLGARGWELGRGSNFHRTWDATSDADRIRIAEELMATFLDVYGG